MCIEAYSNGVNFETGYTTARKETVYTPDQYTTQVSILGIDTPGTRPVHKLQNSSVHSDIVHSFTRLIVYTQCASIRHSVCECTLDPATLEMQ